MELKINIYFSRFVFIAMVTGSYAELLIGESTTMYCFQCNSARHAECASLQSNDTSSPLYIPCLDTEKYNGLKPFCRKIVQRIFPRDNMEVVIRKCGWVRHPRLDCYHVKNEDHEETICQCFEPGCNGAATLHISLAAVILVLLALLV